MLLWKRGYQRQKTKVYKRELRRQPGQVEWVMGLFLILFLGIILATRLQVEAYHAASLYLEDALAASNLASALIDLEEYGISHTILIENPQEAYERYCAAVRENLQLNEQWEGTNKTLISGRVKVENYTIYNVQNDIVTVNCRDSGGKLITWQGSLGAVKAPNGIPIESTSVYSEISFPVEGIFGVKTEAHKGKLVDIVSQVE